jgi:hypothetical protein
VWAWGRNNYGQLGDGTTQDRATPVLVLLQVNCNYTLYPGGQSFPASGGTGAITITTEAGCPWTVSGLPPWVTLTSPSSGTGSGSVSFQVLSNSGADQSGSLTIAGQSFIIEQEAGSILGLNFIGSMPHLPAEANWNTTFTFVNKGPAAAIARTDLFAKDGTALTLPLTLPQQPGLGGPLLASTLDQTIAPNASFVIEAAGLANSQTAEGSAQLLANGNVDGFAIFHFNPTNQEAVVPMETRNAASYLLAFDNTNGVLTGVALANVSTSTANIPVVIRDDTGT